MFSSPSSSPAPSRASTSLVSPATSPVHRAAALPLPLDPTTNPLYSAPFLSSPGTSPKALEPATPSSPVPFMSISPALKRPTVWDELLASLSALCESSAFFPPLQSAMGRLVSCIDQAEGSFKSRMELQALALELKMLSESLGQHFRKCNPPSVSQSIVRIVQSIQEQVELISNKQTDNVIRRQPESGRVEPDLVAYYRSIHSLLRQLQIDATMSTWSVENESLTYTLLQQLNPAKLATYDSSLATEINRRTCTEATRIEILSGLDRWTTDPNSPNIYWMNGMAGTGKTTIACTFAEALRERKRLAASFFCSRTTPECRDVTRLIPTVAYQLAQYSASFRSALCRVLNNDRDVATHNISSQFERFLKGPLLEAKNAMPEGLVIVIDALDECLSNDGVELVLEVLFRAAFDLPLQFFITSRPEPSILNKIYDQAQVSRSILHLHEIEKSLVQADIMLYLREELPFLSGSQVERLAMLSGCLFIYAATAARFIREGAESGDIEGRLEVLLSMAASSKRHTPMDEFYTAILSSAIKKIEDIQVKEQMKLVLWTILCAREPASIEVLAALAGIDQPRQVNEVLLPLRSVIHVSERTGLVSTLHVSFNDFMFDRSRSLNFFCDLSEHSNFFAQRCFELMTEQLQFNICALESSQLLDRHVPNLAERVSQAISPTLAYACRYWGDHLQLAERSEVLCQLLDEFLSERLLFWMEVMNLKHLIGLGVRIMLIAKQWLTGHHPYASEIVRSVNDAQSFITSYAANTISQSTPHIYVSALPFCHRTSTVFRRYWGRMLALVDPMGVGIEQRRETRLASWNVDSEVYSVAYSPDGARLAVGCSDGCIIIKDAHDGSTIGGPLEGHTDYVRSIAFSPDASYIISGSEDYTIRIWNVESCTPFGPPLEGHSNYVHSVAISPDGTRIVSGSRDRTVRVWDMYTGCPLGPPLSGHTNWVNSVAFSPDGTRIVSGSSDRTVRVWDARDGTVTHEPFQGHTSPVRSVAFSPTGMLIASGSDDHTVRLWSVGHENILVASLDGHVGSINSVVFSPDATSIASGSDDRTICVWSVQDGGLLGVAEGHTGSVRSVSFSPDGTRLASGSEDHTVCVWNTEEGLVGPPQGHTDCVRSVTFSPDGSRIVSGSDDCTIRLWNAEDGTSASAPLRGHTKPIKSVSFSPDGMSIASGSDDCTVRLWDARAAMIIGVPLRGHTKPVRSVAFSPDGLRVVSGSDDCTVRLWNARDGTAIGAPIEGHAGAVRSVAFSPDGMRIASASVDYTIRILNGWDGSFISSLRGHTDYVRSIAFSPDGTRIVSGSDDRTIRIWDVRDGFPISEPLEGHTNWINSVAFSPDGTHIVSASDDRTVRTWNAQYGFPVGDPLEGHASYVSSVAFSPDGTRIVSGSKDLSIRLWDRNSNLFASGVGISVKNGWVIGQDSKLLFWVPLDLADFLPTPSNPWVIAPIGSLSIRYNKHLFDGNWDICFLR